MTTDRRHRPEAVCERSGGHVAYPRTPEAAQGRTGGSLEASRTSRWIKRLARMEVRLFDHFPALLAFGIGIGVTVNGRSELAMEFFLLAILAEITRDLAGLRKDVKALRDRSEERLP